MPPRPHSDDGRARWRTLVVVVRKAAALPGQQKRLQQAAALGGLTAKGDAVSHPHPRTANEGIAAAAGRCPEPLPKTEGAANCLAGIAMPRPKIHGSATLSDGDGTRRSLALRFLQRTLSLCCTIGRLPPPAPYSSQWHLELQLQQQWLRRPSGARSPPQRRAHSLWGQAPLREVPVAVQGRPLFRRRSHGLPGCQTLQGGPTSLRTKSPAWPAAAVAAAAKHQLLREKTETGLPSLTAHVLRRSERAAWEG